MARGWESKAVESQQQDMARGGAKSTTPLTASQRAANDRRRTLELARARTLADLRVCTSAAHRSMLEAALRAIDEQLQRISSPG
jgi:hypothetical protein